MGDINHQFGLAAETVYGTAVTPTRFHEFTAETMKRRPNFQQSAGIAPGRRYGGQGRRLVSQDAGGTVTTEVPVSGIGLLFEHLLGDVVTSQPDIPNSPTVYLHTFTPGTLWGKSLTVQKGVEREDGSGTVEPFTYPGSKIVSADFSIGQHGLLMGAWEFDAQQEETSTALATPSLSPPTLFTFAQGTVKVGAATLGAVRSVDSLRIRNNLDVGRYYLGNNGLKTQPKNRPVDELGGTFTADFFDPADLYDVWVADTEITLIVEFVGDVISDDETALLRFTMDGVHFTGDTPQIAGTDAVTVAVPWVGLDPAAGDAVTIELQNEDITP
jgi:hypothetical protein